MITAALVFTVIAAAALPIILSMIVGVKKRNLFAPVVLGVVCFTVFQVLTRIPLLMYVLPRETWFTNMASTQPILYILFLSATAAIFEEFGRYIIMRFFMKKHRTIDDSLAFGLGHGGIEAVLLVGLPYLSVLMSPQPETLAMLTAPIVFASGVERLSTMVVHIGLSVMVMQSIRKKNMLWLLWALLTHTLVNFMSVYALNMMGLNIWLVELIPAAFAVALGLYSYKQYKGAKGDTPQAQS